MSLLLKVVAEANEITPRDLRGTIEKRTSGAKALINRLFCTTRLMPFVQSIFPHPQPTLPLPAPKPTKTKVPMSTVSMVKPPISGSSSLDQFAHDKLDSLERRHLRRTLVGTVRHDGLVVERNGRRLISFSCNDYLGLATHPALAEAARAAIGTYGVGAGASRLVTGWDCL